METEQIELARLKLNEANPRQIRDSRFTASALAYVLSRFDKWMKNDDED